MILKQWRGRVRTNVQPQLPAIATANSALMVANHLRVMAIASARELRVPQNNWPRRDR